jgi:hypothetical protein
VFALQLSQETIAAEPISYKSALLVSPWPQNSGSSALQLQRSNAVRGLTTRRSRSLLTALMTLMYLCVSMVQGDTRRALLFR